MYTLEMLIKVFGHGNTVFPPERPAGRALITDAYCEDCQGRGIKIQTGESTILSPHFVHSQLRTLKEGYDVDIQFGRGSRRGSCR